MVYVLEDDDGIRELVCYSLNKTGTEALGFGTPTEFRAAMDKALPDLIMLDIMLPETDGMTILSSLRASPRTVTIPIIMLTAKGSEFDKVSALDAGADDYITKPFGVMELIARVKAVLRRTPGNAKPEEKTYTAGKLTVSVTGHTVKDTDGNEYVLTIKEFGLLCLLLENRGVVLSRERILNEIWDYEFDGENRTVDVHIRSLRKKLGDFGDIILTVRGAGYKIV